MAWLTLVALRVRSAPEALILPAPVARVAPSMRASAAPMAKLIRATARVLTRASAVLCASASTSTLPAAVMAPSTVAPTSALTRAMATIALRSMRPPPVASTVPLATLPRPCVLAFTVIVPVEPRLAPPATMARIQASEVMTALAHAPVRPMSEALTRNVSVVAVFAALASTSIVEAPLTVPVACANV